MFNVKGSKRAIFMKSLATKTTNKTVAAAKYGRVLTKPSTVSKTTKTVKTDKNTANVPPTLEKMMAYAKGLMENSDDSDESD